MNELWESIRVFLASHRIVTMVATGAIGASVVGAGGYALYNDMELAEAEEETVQEVQVEEEYAAEDVYIPEFKNVVITSESLEKDLTIYFSDEEDNPITGVPFQVKLLKPEAAENLQTYIDEISGLDEKISEYTENSSDASGTLKDRNAAITVTDENGEVVETQRGDISSDPLYQLYLDKETAVKSYSSALNETDGTVYADDDEDGVIMEKDVEPGDYVLCLINEADAPINYEPVDYAISANVKDKVEFKVQKEITKQIKKDVAAEDGQKKEAVPVEATLTDTVEYVDSRKEETGATFKETTDVVAPKATAASAAGKATKKDGGITTVTHKIASRVRAVLKSNGGVAVLNNAIGVKLVKDGIIKVATNDAGSGTTSSTEGEEKKDENTSQDDNSQSEAKTVNINVKCVDENGNVITTYTVPGKEGTSYSIDAKSIDGYTLQSSTSSPATGEYQEGATVTFTYKKNEEPKPEKYTITVIAVDESGNTIKTIASEEKEKGSSYTYTASTIDGYTLKSDATATGTVSGATTVKFTYTKNPAATFTFTLKYVDEAGKDIKAATTETKTQGSSYSYSAPAIDGYTALTTEKFEGTVSKAETFTFKYKKNQTSSETATLDMSYSAGTFTISASTNVSAVKVNGTDVAISNGKGTYKITADGDYTLTGVATFSDNKTDDTLKVTYTVSGFAGSTEKLKDSKGNQLYLDSEGKTEATAANYEKGKKYYYKDASYRYFGWQSINGITYYYDKNGNVVTGTQVIQGVQYNFGSDGALVVKGTGIDVSKYQGNIDWSQAKSSVSFAIIRCGYRGMYDGQLHEDPYFYKNMSGAKAAGVQTGIYIYSTALSEAEAVQEASMAVAMAQKAGGCSYPIYLDMEDTVRGQSGLSTDQRMAIVNAFVSTVQSSGYKGGLYCSKNWMTNRMNAGAVPSSCSVWIAQYNTSCTYSGRKNIWQYSSKGSVPGIKGYVDMNKSF